MAFYKIIRCYKFIILSQVLFYFYLQLLCSINLNHWNHSQFTVLFTRAPEPTTDGTISIVTSIDQQNWLLSVLSINAPCLHKAKGETEQQLPPQLVCDSLTIKCREPLGV